MSSISTSYTDHEHSDIKSYFCLDRYYSRLDLCFTLNSRTWAGVRACYGSRWLSLGPPVSHLWSALKLQFKKSNIKVPISSKLLFSYLILYITQWTSAKKKFDLDKMQSFLEVLKTFKCVAILVHHSHQSSLSLKWVVT